jgi:NADPH:quinone reductase-like Zn-dependent oxidoreductase
MAYSSAYGGLIDIAGLSEGDAAVISAASSSVGLAAIQIANMVGATPIAVSRTHGKRDILLRAGAAHVLAADEGDVAARLNEITGGAGVNVIFDPVAGPLLAELAAATAQYAKLVIYGALSADPTPIPALTLLQKRLTIRGYDMVEVVADDTRLAQAVAFINDGIEQGALTPTVDRVLPLADIADAYAYLEGNAQTGKVVISVSQPDGN